MSAVTTLWRQLVERRLWPVAILLVAALAAVPIALAQDPEPQPAPPVAPVDTKSELATTPIVAKATAADRAQRRKVLGTAKNPFAVVKPAKTPTASASAKGPVVQKSPSGGGGASEPSSGGGSSSGGGAGTGTPTAPSMPAPATPPAADPPAPAPKKYALHELTVRFGGAEEAGARTSLKRLQPLPSAETPVLIYMGVLKDGKTAVFMVDHGVAPIGDGECRPSPEACETLRLQAGETVFLDVKDEAGAVVGQYQLDLIKIHKGTTASAAKAGASSKAGARLVKSLPAAGAYRWNAETGTLEPRRGTLRSIVGRTSARLP